MSGCEEHHFLPQSHPCPDNGGGERRLARAGGATHHHHGMGVGVGSKLTEYSHGMLLLPGGFQPHGMAYVESQLVGYHFFSSFFKSLFLGAGGGGGKVS